MFCLSKMIGYAAHVLSLTVRGIVGQKPTQGRHAGCQIRTVYGESLMAADDQLPLQSTTGQTGALKYWSVIKCIQKNPLSPTNYVHYLHVL